LKHVTTGRLIAHLDRCWDTQQALRDRIARNLPELQERARLTNRIVVDILSGARPPDAASQGEA
jgi:hypothetical protein